MSKKEEKPTNENLKGWECSDGKSVLLSTLGDGMKQTWE